MRLLKKCERGLKIGYAPYVLVFFCLKNLKTYVAYFLYVIMCFCLEKPVRLFTITNLLFIPYLRI